MRRVLQDVAPRVAFRLGAMVEVPSAALLVDAFGFDPSQTYYYTDAAADRTTILQALRLRRTSERAIRKRAERADRAAGTGPRHAPIVALAHRAAGSPKARQKDKQPCLTSPSTPARPAAHRVGRGVALAEERCAGRVDSQAGAAGRRARHAVPRR